MGEGRREMTTERGCRGQRGNGTWGVDEGERRMRQETGGQERGKRRGEGVGTRGRGEAERRGDKGCVGEGTRGRGDVASARGKGDEGHEGQQRGERCGTGRGGDDGREVRWDSEWRRRPGAWRLGDRARAGDAEGSGKGERRLGRRGDGEGRGRTAENETENTWPKKENELHQTKPNMGLSDVRAWAQSKTFVRRQTEKNCENPQLISANVCKFGEATSITQIIINYKKHGGVVFADGELACFFGEFLILRWTLQ